MVQKLVTNEVLQRVAVDIGEGAFDVCLQSTGKHHAKFKKTDLARFRAWLKNFGIEKAQLWMEATGRYFEDLAEWAYALNWEVVVVNPRCIRHFAIAKLKVTKTDPVDAEVILRFAETSSAEEFRLWQPRSAARKRLRDLQVAIKGWKKEIVQERNRLKCGLQDQFTKNMIQETIKHLKEQVKKAHKESIRVIKEDSELYGNYLKLLSVKGFGDVTIAFLLAKIEFANFRKGRQLVKYAGLDVVQWQSGKSIKKRNRISRVGHSDLRSALYLPALTAIKRDPQSLELAARMEQRGASKKTVICAIMARLLRVAFALVRDQKKVPTGVMS